MIASVAFDTSIDSRITKNREFLQFILEDIRNEVYEGNFSIIYNKQEVLNWASYSIPFITRELRSMGYNTKYSRLRKSYRISWDNPA